MPDQRLGSKSKLFWNPGLGSIFGQWGLREAGQGEAHTHKKKKKPERPKASAGLEFAVLPANLGGGPALLGEGL